MTWTRQFWWWHNLMKLVEKLASAEWHYDYKNIGQFLETGSPWLFHWGEFVNLWDYFSSQLGEMNIILELLLTVPHPRASCHWQASSDTIKVQQWAIYYLFNVQYEEGRWRDSDLRLWTIFKLLGTSALFDRSIALARQFFFSTFLSLCVCMFTEATGILYLLFKA